jgi:hypothetical protein
VGIIVASNGLTDAIKDVDFIVEHAKKYRDEAKAIEFGASN